MHFVIVPRHLENYCGEAQSFDLNFNKIQDIDKPISVKCTVDQALKKTLKLYFSDIATNNLLKAFNEAIAKGENGTTVEEFILIREQHEGKYRYTLLQSLDNLTIECIDRTLKLQAFPLVLAEVFEI
jgi:hypothetical protein